MWEYNYGYGYGYTTYNNELMHYGVKGMKWGVRKTINAYGDFRSARAKVHSNKIDTSRTRLGKNRRNYLAYKNERKSRVAKSLANDRGVRKTLSNVGGHGYSSNAYKAASNYYGRKAAYSKTRLGRTVNESRQYNANRMSKYHDRQKNAKSITEYGKRIANEAFLGSIKTWSGRKVTRGQLMVEQMFGANVFFDVAYYATNK